MAADSQFVETADQYNSIFEAFTRGRREQEKVWIDNELVPKLLKVFKLEGSVKKSEFKVLAVGSGVGSFDCLLIKALLTHGKEMIKGKQIMWTVVEPNAMAIDEFKKKVSSDADICHSVSFTWINKGVEDFLQVTEPEEYDLIHFIHILYYVEEEVVLKKSYEKFLGTPGCMVIAVGSEGDIWVNLIKSFRSKIPSLTSELHYPTNIELSEICRTNGWANEVFNGKLDLEITEIFNEGDPKGEAILKFFLHINEDPRKKFRKELISEIMEFFQKMSWKKEKNGEKSFFVNDDVGLLLIYK